jgi:hypothetical protein
MKPLIYGLVAAVFFSGCVASREKKTDKYYFEYEKEIKEIITLYKGLYNHKPFSIGFSDRSYEHVGMDIITDTVRYAIDNLQSMEIFREAVFVFNYDTVAIRKLYKKMYDIKCIWIGTTDIYPNGKREDVIFLTFRSVRNGNPFLDRKYYALLIYNPGSIDAEMELEIQKAGYKKVKNEIYFGIVERFRT